MFWNLIGRKIFYPLTLLLGITLWLLSTETGLKFSMLLIRSLVPGELYFSDVQGKWIEKIEINSLSYESKSISVTIEKTTVIPKIDALLNKTISISLFKIENAKLLLKNKTTEPIILDNAFITFDMKTNGNLINARITQVRGHWSSLELKAFGGIETIGNQYYPSDTIIWLGDNHFSLINSPDGKKFQWNLSIKNLQNINVESRGFFDKGQGINEWFGKISEMTIDPKLNKLWKLKEPCPIFISPDHISLSNLVLLSGKKSFQGKVSANFTLNETGVNANLDFIENKNNTLQLTIETPNFVRSKSILEQPIQGSLKGKIEDFRFVYSMAPHIEKIKGSLEIEGKIIGKLNKPLLQFSANLNQGMFFLPKLGIQPQNLKFQLMGELPGTLNITGKGIVGNGQFQLKGIAAILDQSKINLSIAGKKLQIYNTKDIKINASPEINLDYINNTFFVQGIVHIHESHISIHNQKNNPLLSQDVVLINSKTSDDSHPFKLIPSLYLIIDNQLHYKGHGLDAVIGGKLDIEERPDGLLSGNGKLTINEGKYRIQGYTRFIHQGKLLFPTGTLLTDPLLDIRISEKRPEEYKDGTDIGIYVQGTLQRPVMQLYSSNSNVKSSEILSRLGFGSTESTGEQRQVLSQTAFLLAGSVNPFIEALQDNLGIEEFSIGSRATQNSFATGDGTDTVLVVGKSFTKKIYIQYLQSVMEPIGTIKLKYFLNSQFTTSIETGTEDDIGVDLTFSMETD